MGDQQPVFAVELAEVTRQRPLAIYAGAGLSQASPTDILDGAEIARRCHARLIDALRLDELACEGTVKLTDLRTCSAPWTLPKLLILNSSADRFRLQNPRILLNLNIPLEFSSIF